MYNFRYFQTTPKLTWAYKTIHTELPQTQRWKMVNTLHLYSTITHQWEINSSAYYLRICITMHQFPREKAKGTPLLRFIHLLQRICKDQNKMCLTRKNEVRRSHWLLFTRNTLYSTLHTEDRYVKLVYPIAVNRPDHTMQLYEIFAHLTKHSGLDCDQK